MDIKFFTNFFQLKLVRIFQSAEDIYDHLNYRVTNGILILMVMFVGVRQYIFSPIECWIPHEWSDAWQEYAENFCWVENTYYSDIGEGPPDTQLKKDRLKINYYQWVPFVLGIQCLGFYLPHYIWKILGGHVIGTKFNYIIKFSLEAASQNKESKRELLVTYIAKEIYKVARNNRLDLIHSNKAVAFIRRICGIFGKRSGYALIFVYFFIKILYLLNCVGQIYLMKNFIQVNSLTYGYDILANITQGRSWDLTGVFPRTTWCDLKRKSVGDVLLRSFPCVLPANMVNEKIYIFLWFWTVFLFIATAYSIIPWFCKVLILSNQKNLILKYLKMAGVDDDQLNKQENNTFVYQFLRWDLTFILRMMELNTGEILTSEVVEKMYNLWLADRDNMLLAKPNRKRPSLNVFHRRESNSSNDYV